MRSAALVAFVAVLAASGSSEARLAADRADAPCGDFVSLRPGLFARSTASARARAGSQAPNDGGVAGDQCDAAILGLQNPGPVWRDGNLLYVGNNDNGTTDLVTVVDVSTPGAEFVVEQIATPVDPVDVAVAMGRLYVIDQDRDELWSRPLAGGAWSSIALPNGTIAEWDYGHIIEPLGTRMYVIHQWENLIDVVDLVGGTVVETIADLDHLPDRVVFAGDRMVVLGVGLDAPSCLANGPNFSVFTLPDHQKLYRKNIAGACPFELLVNDGQVWVIFDNRVKRYDLDSGAFVNQLVVPGIGRNAVHRGIDIVGQRGTGEILVIDPDLSAFDTACDLVGDQIWYPPLEQMAQMSVADGRVFVTNRNNDTLDRVWLPAPCPADLDGSGAVDGADLGLLLAQWGGPGGAPNADLDGNGVVDGADLGLLLAAWGPCQARP